MVGPIAGAKVTATANMARPIGCCAFGSLVRTMVKAIGISTPPAKPCRPRSTIIEPRSWAKAQAIEKTSEQDGVGQHDSGGTRTPG